MKKKKSNKRKKRRKGKSNKKDVVNQEPQYVNRINKKKNINKK